MSLCFAQDVCPLQAALPARQISIYRNFSHKILQKVQEGAVDLGIVTLPTTASNMEVIPSFAMKFRCRAQGSRSGKNKSVTVEELAQHPLILPDRAHRGWLLTACCARTAITCRFPWS